MKGLIILSLVILLFAAVSDGKRPLHITSLEIKFDKTEATFTVNYDMSSFPKMYILLLGSKALQSEINSVFSNFDYKITKLDQDEAILRVKNISRFDKGYYLHEPRKFGQIIDKMYIYSPDSTIPREYFNVNSTIPFFYRK